MGGLFLYDALFFVGHFALHRVPGLFAPLHGKHHKNFDVRASDTVSGGGVGSWGNALPLRRCNRSVSRCSKKLWMLFAASSLSVPSAHTH